MHQRHELLRRLARTNASRIVLLVLDGVGDLRCAEQPETPLERARTPTLDGLAGAGSLGRLTPATPGVTPGSGPGHLALFGYDPIAAENDIGRGVLEALGLGIPVSPGTLAARGNFATVDESGRLTDRRAGRIPTEECRRLVAQLERALEAEPAVGLDVRLHAGEGYRFVLLATPTDDDCGLDAEIADTDPQQLGARPLPLTARSSAAESTVERLAPVLETLRTALAQEPRANAFLLRGFSFLPRLPSFESVYGLRAGAFAGYPLYRGVASVCGMEVVECSKQPSEAFATVAARWRDFDFFFVHVKQTDMAGEDGDSDFKTEVIEEVDRALPRLLELAPDVLAITGDHSTPATMKAHSWHPVPLLISAPTAFTDATRRFTELESIGGALGSLPASHLMGLLMAHAGKLAKYGA